MTKSQNLECRLEPRRRIRAEIWILLALSLGRSSVYSIVNLIAMLTDNKALADQITALNPSRSPRPYLDLTYQLLGIFFALAPVLLALYLLTIRPNSQPLKKVLGLDWFSKFTRRGSHAYFRHPAQGDEANADSRHPAQGGEADADAGSPRMPVRYDLKWGLLLALAVGIPGLAFYGIGRALGITIQVQASALEPHWWAIPVLVLSAFQNGALEEFIVVGYLFERTKDIGWSQRENHVPWKFLLASAALRGSYHLYQGIGPFFGNFAMGLLFAWWFTSKWGRHRVLPLVIAHTLLDTVAFVGYALAPATLLRLLGFS